MVWLVLSAVCRVSADSPPRERLEELCPDLQSRGFVDYNEQNWKDCGDGAFHESTDVTEGLGLLVSSVYDSVVFDSREIIVPFCDGIVNVLQPRVVKACQSTVDSREVRAILRAQLTCTAQESGDEISYDEDDVQYGPDDDDDFFYLYQEGGPVTIDGLWTVDIDLSTGAFELEEICFRQVPRITPRD